jgi:hypothetical protein
VALSRTSTVISRMASLRAIETVTMSPMSPFVAAISVEIFASCPALCGMRRW